MNRKATGFLLFALVLALLAPAVHAQNSGKIVGLVIDKQSGEPLIGANVVVEGTSLGATTDLEGNYIILRVSPGKYTITGEYIGYQKIIYRNIEIMTDLTTKLDFQLGAEVIQGETIEIFGEAPVIRKDLTSVEARVQAEDIAKMPVQDLGDLLNLQAGVVRDAGGGIHIRGGRSTEVSYMINGISITDDFSRGQALQVENESIQELQVISGTFNAEYGNAMSGIINVVTKTGGDKLKGDLEVWSGDYVSSRKDIFWNINKLSPTGFYNLQGSLSGPLLTKNLTFFATARRWYTDGWLYGPNAYRPQGRMAIVDGDTVPALGDSSAVSMNFRDRWSGQGSLEWGISNVLRMKVDFLGSYENRRNYNHYFRLNPKGYRGDVETGYSSIAKLTHQLGTVTFHELTIAYKYNDLVSKLYDDYNDSRYVASDSLISGAYQFAKAGTDLGMFDRSSQSRIAKWDITSQITKRHLVKGGLELQYDKVDYNDINLIAATDDNGEQINPFVPYIDDISTQNHNQYSRSPNKFAIYIQDKIEYESLIINIGLRYDRFDANGQVPADPEDPNIYNPFKEIHIYKDLNADGIIDVSERTSENVYSLNERKEFWYKSTSIKSQLSPRLGVAYPITEKGVIHFSYGIFQQTPEYNLLYTGDQLKIGNSVGSYGPYGNPDLNPQRTTMYELGLQQEFMEGMAIDVTGFYRDVREWISTGPAITTAIGGVSYVVYKNRDYANIRGITLSVDKRYSQNYGFSFDYTYQIAEGTNSNPEDEFFAQQGGAEATKLLTPLNWDQRHSVNGSLFFGGETWGGGFIARFNSGQPYTPYSSASGTRTSQTILAGVPDNSRNKPSIFSVDFNTFKNISYSSFQIQLFLKIFNLFDADNPVNIYGDTGQADYTLESAKATYAAKSWFVNPGFYSEPRRIQLGMKVSFR
jgi:outer membrane receptor protein involved in Fe transport